jgi:UDP-N-acetylglucosamine 2-epimerase (non-hydrolysing)
MMDKYGLTTDIGDNVLLLEPLGYLDFVTLLKNSELVLTDSGGIQEETTYFGVQCVTLRKSTERPITVEIGTNHLAGDDPKEAERISISILNGATIDGKIPEMWDGKTAERIADIITTQLL